MVDPRPVRPGKAAWDEARLPPRSVASQGAQVALISAGSGEAAAGAQGTAGETFVENTQARDEGLEDLGIDPQGPSGISDRSRSRLPPCRRWWTCRTPSRPAMPLNCTMGATGRGSRRPTRNAVADRRCGGGH